jgi:hypothetical protein
VTMARQLERWAPLGGIIFVVLIVVGTMFVADVPDPDAPQQQLANYLADSGNHTRNIIGAYIWVVGALAFLHQRDPRRIPVTALKEIPGGYDSRVDPTS